MARVEFLRNEIHDSALARRFEREIVSAVERVDAPEATFACAILDEGLHAEIEIALRPPPGWLADLPGWTERVLVPYPARAGDVRRALGQLLRDTGLVAEADLFHVVGMTRGL
ncbi:MAG TPA: hypothetical protein VFK70_13755 [Vicinamibacteria bacterium]|nr:hypothetical protein [Vicinamibacteria bacterium]